MKKWQILVPGLVVAVAAPIVSLTACNDPDHPIDEPKFSVSGSQDDPSAEILCINNKATIFLNWEPIEEIIQFDVNSFGFVSKKSEIKTKKVTVKSDLTVDPRPVELEIDFTEKPLTSNIDDGELVFNYEDKTSHRSDTGKVENIRIILSKN